MSRVGCDWVECDWVEFLSRGLLQGTVVSAEGLAFVRGFAQRVLLTCNTDMTNPCTAARLLYSAAML